MRAALIVITLASMLAGCGGGEEDGPPCADNECARQVITREMAR
jgi:hypothetical protein